MKLLLLLNRTVCSESNRDVLWKLWNAKSKQGEKSSGLLKKHTQTQSFSQTFDHMVSIIIGYNQIWFRFMRIQTETFTPEGGEHFCRCTPKPSISAELHNKIIAYRLILFRSQLNSNRHWHPERNSPNTHTHTRHWFGLKRYKNRA